MTPDKDGQLRAIALVPAAGRGERVGGPNKLLRQLEGLPVIAQAVATLQRHPRITAIYVLTPPDAGEMFAGHFADRERWSRVVCLPVGGATRQDTVRNGIEVIQAGNNLKGCLDSSNPPGHVIVHDGARPCLPQSLIDRVLNGLRFSPVVVPVLPMVDTVRTIAGDWPQVVPRDRLMPCQTPQAFEFSLLREVHAEAARMGFVGTDDAQLTEPEVVPLDATRAAAAAGLRQLVPGARRNIKVTTEADFDLASWLLVHPDWGC